MSAERGPANCPARPHAPSSRARSPAPVAASRVTLGPTGASVTSATRTGGKYGCRAASVSGIFVGTEGRQDDSRPERVEGLCARARYPARGSTRRPFAVPEDLGECAASRPPRSRPPPRRGRSQPAARRLQPPAPGRGSEAARLDWARNSPKGERAGPLTLMVAPAHLNVRDIAADHLRSKGCNPPEANLPGVRPPGEELLDGARPERRTRSPRYIASM